LIKYVLIFKNNSPVFVAALSSNFTRNGFLMMTSATVNRIKNSPYSIALRTYNDTRTRSRRGHNGDNRTAAGW